MRSPAYPSRVTIVNGPGMAAYAIVDLHIYDIARYIQYQRALSPLLRVAGGRYLARGGEFEVLAGDMQPERLVLIEFPSMDALRDFYESPQVQELEPQREACSRICIIAVNGLPQPVEPEA